MATEETGTTGGIAGKENNSGEVPENEKKPLDERAPFSSPIIQLPPWAPAGNTPPLRSGNPTDGTPPVLRNALETDSPTETPFERNLREVGLKEALPHGGIAPDRVVPGEIGPESESGVARIRTYAADMGEEMKKRKATISSIISAEQSRPAPPPIESDASPKRRWGFIAGAFILALVGISALVWALFLRPSSPAPETRSSIISINRRAVLPIEPAKSFVERLAEEKNSAALNLGEIEEIEITKNGVPASPEDVLRGLGAPSELARNATGIFVG
ncbi:MAG: hypothetical protein JO026_03235, partial [Patescibacteria group bacterium]|nr:hypothetical protein [Patescibacteria group bacterium]